MGEYVVRAPVKWGSPDGSVVWLQPGEKLPGEVTEEERLQLLAAGTVVPAETHRMVEEQDEKRRKLEEDRLKLDQQQAALQTEDLVLQAEAEKALAESQPEPSPERGVVTPRPTRTEDQKSAEALKQTEQKAREARETKPEDVGKSGPQATHAAQGQAQTKK